MDAILLIGPTGSGKTPLGDWLQAHGLAGGACRHFDFGAHLRVGTGLNASEQEFVREVLATGTLLENETFHVAEKILRAFIAGHEDELLILNGLPRHVGQAVALAPLVNVAAVVHLQADAHTIRERLRRNAGGDRTGRVDDDLTLVERKLATFTERTLPLIEHYQSQGVPVLTTMVGEETTPKEMVDDTGLEPVASSMSRKRSSQLS
jgi:adenylate kinase